MKAERTKVYKVVDDSWALPPRVEELDVIVLTLDDGRRGWVALGGVWTLDRDDSDVYSTKKAADAVCASVARKSHTERSRRLHREVAELKVKLQKTESALKAHKAKKPARK